MYRVISLILENENKEYNLISFHASGSNVIDVFCSFYVIGSKHVVLVGVMSPDL